MDFYPKVLRLETGFAPSRQYESDLWAGVLDYTVYANVPRWWRKVEQLLRLDIVLALHASKIAHQYDIIWAWSEKVGIPLALMGVNKPLVTVCQHMASARKRKLIKLIGVTRKWAGMAYFSEADRDFMISYYQVPYNRLINCMKAPINQFTPVETNSNGPIISLGVSKRDYGTLIAALHQLPGYETEIYVSSRYADLYNGDMPQKVPDWIHFVESVTDEELVERYKRARFVVLPLMDTTQFAAGASVALEASASGKAVIATKTEGMPTYVIDGVTGLLVPPYDTEALRQAIYKLWNDPGLAHQMGLAGRQHVEKKFNPITVNQELKQFLTKVYRESQRG